MAETKETLQKDIETKTKELDALKSKILAEIEENKKKDLETQKTKLEDEIKALQKQLDVTVDETKKETKDLKDDVEVDNDQTYELIKDSKMYNKLIEIGKNDDEIKEFAEEIDKVVRKFIDQELD